MVFDWDGTLAMTMHSLVKAYKKAFVKRGLVITQEQLKHQIFGNWQDGIKSFAVPKHKQVFEEIADEVQQEITHPDLYPYVRETLAFLSKKKKLVLVTTSDENAVKQALFYHDIRKFFDSIITSKDINGPKPNPELLIKAVEKINALITDTIYIGNSKNDVEMANYLEMANAIFYPKENEEFYSFDELEQAKPHMLVKKFTTFKKTV